jgi:hypothetical protein
MVSDVDTSHLLDVVVGTWKLISSKRTNLSTGNVEDSFGTEPLGFIMYHGGGRMMVLMANGSRPQPESMAKITDEQRQQLFSTFIAYAGSFQFDGDTIKHTIDVSWNELWTGTTQVRQVKKDGDRLIYTSSPAPSALDGSMGFATHVWERVK